jgi:hypothetical protein
MAMTVRHLPLAGLVLSALVRLEPAWACGELPCAQRHDVQPADGSVGVPRNPELRVLYFGALEYFTDCEVDLRPMRLVPSAGEPILLTGTAFERASAYQTWMVARHVDPLAANTRYALQLLLGDGIEACRCDGREWTTVAAFTTGESEDDEGPAFAGLEAVDYGARTVGSSDCGEGDRVPVSATFTPAGDMSPGMRYNIYVDGEIAKRYVDLEQALARSGEIFVDCGSSSLSTATDVPAGAVIEVRAVDLAGNESAPNDDITIAAVCDDGGNLDHLDDGREDGAEAAAPAAAASGCTLSHEPGVAPLALGALAMLLAGLRRRRHPVAPG